MAIQTRCPTSPSKPPKAKRSSSSPTPATHRKTSPSATKAKPSPHRSAPAPSAPTSGRERAIIRICTMCLPARCGASEWFHQADGSARGRSALQVCESNCNKASNVDTHNLVRTKTGRHSRLSPFRDRILSNVAFAPLRSRCSFLAFRCGFFSSLPCTSHAIRFALLRRRLQQSRGIYCLLRWKRALRFAQPQPLS